MKKLITSAFACLECRKSFKKHRYEQLPDGSWSPLECDIVCPQCCGKVYDAGVAFKAPKHGDVKEWEKLRPLFESGYRFNPDRGSPFLPPPPPPKPNRMNPGSKSLFQVQRRKRHKKTQQDKSSLGGKPRR